MTRLRQRLPSWLTSATAIAVGMGVMNVTTYGFTLLAARLLGPAEYGAVAALMGVMLVLNVVALGLQAAAARRISRRPDLATEVRHHVVKSSWRAGLALCVVTLASFPLLVSTVRLDSVAPVALLAAACVPLTIMGGQAGILQGERRWLPLALLYVAVGVGRLGLGLLGMWWGANVVGAMAGIAAGAVVPVLVGWAALRGGAPAPGGPAAPTVDPSPTEEALPSSRAGILSEVVHNSHALLAFFALSNADVILARSVLPAETAGLYAGGLILAKAVLFLPQFVVVLVFPQLAHPSRRRRMELGALGVVLTLGGLTTVAAALFSSYAVLFVGGSQYLALEPIIWAFAALGTLWAMEQLMVYSTVARQSRRTVGVIWLGLGVLVVGAQAVSTITQLLWLVSGVHVIVLAALIAFSRNAHLRYTAEVSATS